MRTLKILVASAACLAMGTALAAVPETIHYQSYLQAADGSPIDDPALSIDFALYTVPSGGTPIWVESQVVSVTQGLFSVELGASVPFPSGTFDTPTYLGISVGTDPEMTPRRAIASVAYAIEADNAMTLQGQTASSLDQGDHVVDSGNPHAVTAAQIGAASSSDFSAHEANPSAHQTRYTDNEAVAAILGADGPGSTLNADLLDGLDSGAFVQSATDWGRPGVTGTLYEGATALSNLYVNEGQVNSVTGLMIANNAITAADINFSLGHTGSDVNGGLISMTNSSAGSAGNFPMGLLGQASSVPGAYYTFGVAGLAPGLGAGAPILDLPGGNKYGVAGVVDTGIGTAGLSNNGIGVLADGTTMGVKAIGINGPTKGYLGVQGATNFDGEDALDILGREIGVLGYSAGTSTTDNFAFYGVSNGTGIYAQGDRFAGEFVGDITTDRVAYNTPRTHYYSVGDGDFYSALGNSFSTSFGNGGAYMTVAGTQVMVAGLHLPDGATVTEFRVFVDDNSAGDLSVRLSRLSHGGNGFVSLASVLSAGTPGLATYTDTTISVPQVDNELYSYHVRVYSDNWPGNSTLKIKGAVVEYTIAEAH